MSGRKKWLDAAASVTRRRVMAPVNASESGRVWMVGNIELRSSFSSINSPRNYDTPKDVMNGASNRMRPLNGIAKNHMNPKKGMIPSKVVTETSTNPRTRTEKPMGEVIAVDLNTNKTAMKMEPEELMSAHASPSELSFTGDTPFPVTSHLHIVTPEEDTPRGVWPIFRIMDEDGTFRDGTNDGFLDYDAPTTATTSISTNVNDSSYEQGSTEHKLATFRDSLCKVYPKQASEIEKSGLLCPSKSVNADTDSRNTLERLLRVMLRLREMDSIFHNAQRQGRLSFYLTCTGEEGIHLGAAAALESEDVILGQYREQGPIMWRGFTLQQFADQCFSNEADLGKGRQMPIHYGSRALNYQTISSPLGTQIPQSVGVALRLKKLGKKAVSICFFGEGCTSTTDFHSGLNFAATLKCPVIFFCRNNGYAISTPVKEQFAGDGVVSRAPGYGMAAIRVDGNDVFAVNAAVREARQYAIENSAPVLIEAMSYRQGHHSTSDDSLQYRSAEEIERFARQGDPLNRLKNFLKHHHYDDMTDEKIQSIVEQEKKAILDALRKAERKPKPPLEDLFTDVYLEMPPSLKAQQKKLNEHISKYPDAYTY